MADEKLTSNRGTGVRRLRFYSSQPSGEMSWVRHVPASLAVIGAVALLALGRCSQEFAGTVISVAITGRLSTGVFQRIRSLMGRRK